MMIEIVVSFSIAMLGFSILKHEMHEFFFDFGLNISIFNFISYFLTIILLIATFFSLESPIYLWSAFFFLILSIFAMPFFARTIFENEIQKESLIFQDKIILIVSSGMSLKAAMDKSLEDMNGWRKRQFHDLVRVLNLSQNISKIISPTLKNLAEELEFIHRSQVKTLEQLQRLRRHIKLRLDLRHKSRQVALNMNIQAGFLFFVFVGVSLFSYSNYETTVFLKYLFPAIIWFSLGCLVLFYLQRNHEWKI